MRLLRSLSLLLPAAGLLASCEGALDPGEGASASEAELTFLRVDPQAPAITGTVVSFWAVRGQEREAQITYQTADGYEAKCLRFVVPAGALPAGRYAGDSVQITIRMPDAHRFDFQFEPSGLQFEAAHPAQLEVQYLWANPDYNGNGVPGDSDDLRIAQSFGFWRQERPGERWTKIATSREDPHPEAYTAIPGFTKYALASE